MHLKADIHLHGGKYTIIDKIGQGGFGIVYKAHHLLLDKTVCIKEFFYSDLCERRLNSSELTIVSTSPEKIDLVNSFRNKFIKEAQRLATFQHPNIVQVTDVFEENNTAYFVMEYLSGGSLQDKLDKEILTERQSLDIMLPILDALSTVHRAKLLHLDIKPLNIMFRHDNTPVLIDFGISKYMPESIGHTSTAPIGLSKGYAPIEQYGGNILDFNEASDIYSVCATMYRMVTGVVPPEPFQILASGINSPNDLRPQLSLDFSNTIVKGMSVKAIDRPQSATELKGKLNNRKRGGSVNINEEYGYISQDKTEVVSAPVKKKRHIWLFIIPIIVVIGSSFVYWLINEFDEDVYYNPDYISGEISKQEEELVQEQSDKALASPSVHKDDTRKEEYVDNKTDNTPNINKLLSQTQSTSDIAQVINSFILKNETGGVPWSIFKENNKIHRYDNNLVEGDILAYKLRFNSYLTMNGKPVFIDEIGDDGEWMISLHGARAGAFILKVEAFMIYQSGDEIIRYLNEKLSINKIMDVTGDYADHSAIYKSNGSYLKISYSQGNLGAGIDIYVSKNIDDIKTL